MTPWELAACVQGYNVVHGGEQAVEPPSDEQFNKMLETRH